MSDVGCRMSDVGCRMSDVLAAQVTMFVSWPAKGLKSQRGV